MLLIDLRGTLLFSLKKASNQFLFTFLESKSANLASDLWRRLFPTRRRRSSFPIIPRAMMEINPFKLCSGLKVLGYFMILLVAAIIGVTYYAVVVLTWAPSCSAADPTPSSRSLSSSPFIFWDPGSVPENWGPVAQVSEENLEDGSSIRSSGYVAPEVPNPTGSASDALEKRSGYCTKCHNGKPPRCHHCSVCQRCVLKMDHHCIWVVNCVGARNYKFFLLFLLYTFLETTMNTLLLLPSFIDFFQEAKNHSSSPGNLATIFLAFVLNLAFALSLLCFVIMHVSLLSSNTTSVEVYEKTRGVRWTYDLGRRKNFEQVFGTKKALWFFPMFAKEDLDNIPALHGLEFPTYSDVES